MIRRYNNVETLLDENSRKYLKNVIYPNIPLSEEDFYVVTTVGDRYDKLAFDYYNDTSLWWIIASTNPQAGFSLVPIPGVQIRIPADKQQAITLFRNLNT